MNSLANAASLIVQTAFGLIIGLFLYRFLMQGWRVDFRNQVSQLVYRITNPVLMPIQKLLPVVRGWNLAALTIALLLTAVEAWLLYRIVGIALPPLSLAIVTVGMFVQFASFTLMWMIIITALMSLFSPDYGNPLVQILHRLSEPMLKPFRRIVPPIGGIDLSPVFAVLVLQLIRVLVAEPLIEAGFSRVVLGA